MNVLGISGTARINGNSAILLDFALNPFKKERWDTKHLKMSELVVKPCDGCDKCLDSGECVLDDDMNYFYEAFDWCDAIIISSPVYSFSGLL